MGYQSQKIKPSKFKRTFNCDHLQRGEPSPCHSSLQRAGFLLHCSHHLFVAFGGFFSEFISQMPKSTSTSSQNRLRSRCNTQQQPEEPGHGSRTGGLCSRGGGGGVVVVVVTGPNPPSSRRGITPGAALHLRDGREHIGALRPGPTPRRCQDARGSGPAPGPRVVTGGA